MEGVGLFFDLSGTSTRKDNVVRNNTQGSSRGAAVLAPTSGESYVIPVLLLAFVMVGTVAFICIGFESTMSGKGQAPAPVLEADQKSVSAEAAPHACEGCVLALRAVEDLARNLRARHDLLPTEQRLTPAEYQQARAYLASTAVNELPTGWESGIVVKKLAEGGGHDFALLVADGSYRVLQAGAYSEGPVPGNQLRVELDSRQLSALLDLGDHLILNPATFGRRRDSPQWVLKVGEWHLVKKFAVPTSPPR